ncbi:MAG: NAD-binding protein, partial [Thiohalorhabdaceae bacterium]
PPPPSPWNDFTSVPFSNCAGVIAISRTDEANLSIAVASKLLAPKVPVICRARYRDTEANLASFGTDHIINPFDTVAERFAMAVRSPAMYLVYAWLTGIEHQPVARPVVPPHGKWILCGFGRFGKAMRERLSAEGVTTVVVEAEPDSTQAPLGTVVGRGTEAETLQEAGIENAVGIIAGTDSDPNNLSIILTARELNPHLFTVTRQCRGANQPIFDKANPDLVLDAGTILTRELLERFLDLTLAQDDAWANVRVSRISALVGDDLPETWSLTLGHKSAPAILDYLRNDHPVRLVDLLTDPRDRNQWLPALPLLVQREGEHHLLPEEAMALRPGDQILFCGWMHAARHMSWTASDHGVLSYVSTGEDRPQGWLWEWLARRGNRARA